MGTNIDRKLFMTGEQCNATNHEDAEDDLPYAVILQSFEDIKEMAMKYYYYVVDNRERNQYRLLEENYSSKDAMLFAISKELKDIIKILPLLGCVVDNSTYFCEHFINKIKELYPDFVEYYADELKAIIVESKVN